MPDTSRVPQHDKLAEKAVLSACLIDPLAFDAVVDIVQPDSFFIGPHRTIWEAMIGLDHEQGAIDLTTVASKLQATEKLHQIGGSAYLAELSDATPDIGNIEEHARIVADLGRQRRIVTACQIGVAEGYSPTEDVEAYAQRVCDLVSTAADVGVARDKPETVGVLASKAFTEIAERVKAGGKGDPNAVTTGLVALDNKLCGGMTSNLYILAGRPGMGKTGLALQKCLAAAKSGRTAVFFSAEMPKEQLVMRLIAQESEVPFATLKGGIPNREDWAKISAATQVLAKLPMSIVYRPGGTLAEIRSVIRRETAMLQKTFGAKRGMAAVDYIQILNGQARKQDNRTEEVSIISRSLMAMCGQFDMPILALSQLNREVEKRPNKRPIMSDIRESGSIEQDAYAIMFIYRDEYYNEDSADRGMAEINLVKHRNGATGMVKVRFNPGIMRFDNDCGEQIDDFDDFRDN